MSIRRVSLLAVVALTAGCVEETRDGDTTVVTFAPWVGLLVVAPGLLGVMVGLVILRWQKIAGAAVAGLALLGTAAIAPNLFADRVTVNPERFTLRTGFWFAPTVRDVPFRGLTEIAITAEERPTRQGTRTSYTLECKGSGPFQRVPVGDLMKNGGWKAIEAEALRQGVPVVDRTGGR